jgi:hypothetical protein
MNKRRKVSTGARFLLICLLMGGLTFPRAHAQTAENGPAMIVFNIKDFGATGRKVDNARPAIQRAVNACDEAGGGMVYLPPGEYTSGTIHLRSHVRFFIEAGATLFASRDKQDYDKLALFYGEDLANISIEGRGLVDGQSEYEWRLNDIDDRFIRDNQLLMEAPPAVVPQRQGLAQNGPPPTLPGCPNLRSQLHAFAELDDPSLRLRTNGHRRSLYL